MIGRKYDKINNYISNIKYDQRFESIFLSAFKNSGNIFLLNYENQFKYHNVKKRKFMLHLLYRYVYLYSFFFK